MDEVQLLLEKAESKLNSAKILLENKVYDDAISRGYYCMYYAAKAVLCLKKKFPKTHRGLMSQFGMEFIKEGVIEGYYASAITTAQERRERADYDLYYNPSEEEAESIVEDAERFLERMRKAVDDLK